MKSHPLQRRCRIVEHEEIGPQSRQLVLDASEIASLAVPGQFVHLLCGDTSDPLLRRPFSLHNAGGYIWIMYEIRGRGTALLAERTPGEVLDVIGPLGNGFALPQSNTQPVLLVGGGIGAAPLYFLAEAVDVELSHKCMHFFMGGRSVDRHCCFDHFFSYCFGEVDERYHICTDDGSCGNRGFVTDPLATWLVGYAGTEKPIIYACGPTPMLEAVSKLAREHDCDCQVSVEAKMACGVGACLSCVIKVRDGDSFKYVRSCAEGPVFDARDVVWE